MSGLGCDKRAEFALERLLTSMNAHVRLQITSTPSGKRTLTALERLIASVSALMHYVF